MALSTEIPLPRAVAPALHGGEAVYSSRTFVTVFDSQCLKHASESFCIQINPSEHPNSLNGARTSPTSDVARGATSRPSQSTVPSAIYGDQDIAN